MDTSREASMPLAESALVSSGKPSVEPLLSVTNLHKKFGGIVATNNANLDVNPGMIHAIIGPNGAGKTTLISQISGQLRPDSGKITFEGRDITRLSIASRALAGLARSYQITSVILQMSLLENVMLAVQSCSGHSFSFWSAVRNDTRLKERAIVSLEQVGLNHRVSRLAANVSHGEQRQLEVAMALAMDPKLLLLDEPMAGMGKDETHALITILEKLKEEKTLLLVEHDMDAVFSLADRLSVLVDGHIIATDTVTNIRNNSEVQRAYLGDNHA